ncbi:hypothetical protein [Bradyrhizobium lablabi]|nr:hypothetical protein [Bradyrhizobium lablabi]
MLRRNHPDIVALLPAFCAEDLRRPASRENVAPRLASYLSTNPEFFESA